MKVVIATDTYYPNVNGASYFTQRLSLGLIKAGHQVLVIAPSRTQKQGFDNYENVRVYGVRSVPVFIYKGFRVALPFLAKKALKEVIAEFGPEVIHLQGHFFISRSVLKIAKELGIPTIGTNHFMPENLLHYFFIPKFLEELVKKLAWSQFRQVFEKLDIVTTPTKSAADYLKKTGFTKGVRPVSCGIDLERFNPKNNGDYLAKRYKLPQKPILLSVGRLDKEKNLDVVLKAVQEVSKSIDFHFVIAGSGAYATHLQNLVKKYNIESYATFTGFVSDEDLPNLYCLADCFIIAGTVELQGIVVMEAMASGLPVIAVEALALPELVKNGENGYLFRVGDIQAISESISLIFSNQSLRQKMAQKSLAIIQEHDITRTINQYVRLYEDLTKQKNES